ncbi:succinate dehydrogenase/fumarate reductase iron-sulfur subunit [Thermoleophilia bacterium SCSIO 60948]|nr:succinate dehydrogenase/fumarate reductase iron-sulfur subunit [Thermoleophilia bacterium SCSIO 60948]
MDFKLKVWRQDSPEADGEWARYEVEDINSGASLLEMLDILNERLITEGERPIAFDYDCREGICGSCALTINSVPHGPRQVTSCQVFMREFEDGQEIVLEPFRATAFPVVQDLAIDRSAFDRVVEAGGYISVTSGPKPEPNANPVSPEIQQDAMDAAICIGCGACVAACPNGSAMLFTGAKSTHLNVLPQGEPERYDRTARMVEQMDAEGFGGCTNTGECEYVCPQEISIKVIGELYRDYRTSMIHRLRSRRGDMKAQ